MEIFGLHEYIKDVVRRLAKLGRRVAQECEKLGLDLNVVGSGLAVDKTPLRV